MSEVAIGIDVGTSYTKAVARTEDGTIVGTCRVRSPQFDATRVLIDAFQWWLRFKQVLRCLLKLLSSSQSKISISALCVSAIGPTLMVFDAKQPDMAYGILYSSLLDMDDASLTPLELTERRIRKLKAAADEVRFLSPRLTDLVGYINWRLTGNLTINSVTLVESGVIERRRSSAQFVVGNTAPKIIVPSECLGDTIRCSAGDLGIKAGIPVCGGSPDTLATVVAAGLRREGETMLHLGTFGSFMRLETSVDVLLRTTGLSKTPFRWLLSIPGFGPTVESLACQWFHTKSTAENLHLLDRMAEQAPPGAGGTLLLVPRWKSGMSTVGKYEFVASRNGDIVGIPRRARAVLESIAYAILALDILSDEVTFAGGGGTRSRIWLNALATVLNREIRVCDMAWEAVGTADIAGMLAWSQPLPIRTNDIISNHSEEYQAPIEDNLQQVKERYYENGWLK